VKFLLHSLACLVPGNKQLLMFSGKFNTIYLASKSMGATAENSPECILMHEVNYFKKYSLMRKNGNCQLHTVWADEAWWKYCSIKCEFRVDCISNMVF
uniref:Uncharacterized protein n=1 Tax=Mus spicilegus TaxID=10103 RepID=A0A8C6IGB8_MUSSI